MELQGGEEEQEARARSRYPAAPLGLGLGLGLWFFLSRSRSLKPFSTAVRVADGAIASTRAFRSIHSLSPSAILLASKALTKGYKATKLLYPAAPDVGLPPHAKKRIKAILGAANLVRYALSPVPGDGFLGLGLFKFGYKLSKNFAKVLEGFVGLQLDSAARNGMDALGLMVKTAVVATEVAYWVGIGWWRRCHNRRRFARPLGLRCEVRLHCQRTNLGVKCVHTGQYRESGFSSGAEKAGCLERPLRLCIPELLCLSVPIHHMIPNNSV